MEKLITLSGQSEKGVFTFDIMANHRHLEKTAAEYHPEIAEYIRNAQPKEGKTQVLITALGAGEYWGANKNGDYFPEDQLAHEGDDYGYRTFKIYAKVYKHHVNKDPNKSYGDVTLAVYNPAYHRVELIVEIDNKKAPDLAERIANGDFPDWSMGTRVPYDVCSVCGNKAPNRSHYCDHLKFYLNKVDPATGKLCYAINIKPRFFDISQVFIGADRIAKTLMKVASAEGVPGQVIGSAFLAEKIAQAIKRANINKKAEIEKRVPADSSTPPSSQDNVEALAQKAMGTIDGIQNLRDREPAFKREDLDRMAQHPLSDILSTLVPLGILPKPQEFQRIYLIQSGHRDWADELDRRNMCFDPSSVEEPSPEHMQSIDLSPGRFSDNILRMVRPMMPARSCAMPHLMKRITILVKHASQEPELPTFFKVAAKKDDKRKNIGILPVLLAAAGVYAALAKKAPAATGNLDKIIQSPAGIGTLAALGVGMTTAFNRTVGPKMKGNYTPYMDPNPDTNDVFSVIERAKEKPFLKVGASLGPAARRLFAGIPVAYMGSGVLQKHREANPYNEEGKVKSFIRKNPDLISGALIADAAMSARGGGTHGLMQKAKKAMKFVKKASYEGSLEEALTDCLVKTADEAQEIASHSLIWPVALGAKNLPGRVVGGLIDYAAFKGIDSLSKRKSGRKNVGTEA